MNESHLKTPITLLIFNRPDTTEKVFEAIRQARPQKLFVIADGPRLDKPGEAEKCAATRAIIERVDWECEVFKNYSDVNLGCGKRPATGISWVFEQVEEAIILEDDCLPHPTFFRFCEELLEKYRDESQVLSICGSNYKMGNQSYSYYFSRYFICWGWATWRRAWYNFDFEMKRLPGLLEKGWLEEFLGDPKVAQLWHKNFQKVYCASPIHIWDYQWQFAAWLQNGLFIRPNANLISNLGFGAEATHTIDNYSYYASLPFKPISFPLEHPQTIVRDVQADKLIHKNWLRQENRLYRGYKKVGKLLKSKMTLKLREKK